MTTGEGLHLMNTAIRDADPRDVKPIRQLRHQLVRRWLNSSDKGGGRQVVDCD